MIAITEIWMPTNVPLPNGYWKNVIGNGGSWLVVPGVGHVDSMVRSRSK